jgi:hypothetical protein
MTVQIQVEGQAIAFRLDFKNSRWHCLAELEEAVFPLITVVNGKRYEFYSEGTFEEVEK